MEQKALTGKITWVNEDGTRGVISSYDDDEPVHIDIEDVVGGVARLEIGTIVQFIKEAAKGYFRATRISIL